MDTRRMASRLDRAMWQGCLAAGVAVTVAHVALPAGTGAPVHAGIAVAAVAAVVVRIRRQLVRDLRRRAGFDPLTSLPNRSLLFDRLEQAQARIRRSGAFLTVLYVDLDRFKLVNDAHGHAVGDALLAAVAERLRTAVRQGDTVARVGGDEFVVLCENHDGHEAALAAADRLSLALIEPIRVRGVSFPVSASVGVAIGDGTEPADALVNDADAAMYRAKELGRGRAELFERSMRQRAPIVTPRLDHDLEQAVELGQLRLYFQPQLELASGNLVGVEALLRWQHPELGMLPPATVVPLAEETGLILGIGGWVIEEACRRARHWHDGGTQVEMTVNLSARQLLEPDLPDAVAAALSRWRVDPGWFTVDVIGSSQLLEDGRAAECLRALREMGVHVAIDDFGPGGDPLGTLRLLPADRLKIDRGLVKAVTEMGADRTILAAIVALGHELGMRVVAEGVETRPQRQELIRIGCEQGLGHLWAPPLPPGSVLDQVLGRDHAVLS